MGASTLTPRAATTAREDACFFFFFVVESFFFFVVSESVALDRTSNGRQDSWKASLLFFLQEKREDEQLDQCRCSAEREQGLGLGKIGDKSLHRLSLISSPPSLSLSQKREREKKKTSRSTLLSTSSPPRAPCSHLAARRHDRSAASSGALESEHRVLSLGRKRKCERREREDGDERSEKKEE